MKEENSGRLRKLRNLFEILNKAFSKFLELFWTSDCRRNYFFFFVKRKGHFPTVRTWETWKFWHKNLQNLWPDCLHVRYDSLLFTCRHEQHSTKVGLSGQWKWGNQNVTCELRTVWIEKISVKCGEEWCVCRKMMFDTTTRHNYNNSEAVISYVNLRPEQ